MSNTTVILKKYFGYLPGQSLQGFAKEVRALSKEQAHELADLAAAELGIVHEPAS